MRKAIRAFAYAGLAVSGLLALLGIAAWPPGGMMFALPYVFFLLAALIGGPSALVLVVTRQSVR